MNKWELISKLKLCRNLFSGFPLAPACSRQACAGMTII